MTQFEVFEAISYIDTSAGWTLIIGAGTLSILCRLRDRRGPTRPARVRDSSIGGHTPPGLASRQPQGDGQPGLLRRGRLRPGTPDERLAQAAQPCDVATQIELRASALYVADVAAAVCERMFRHAGARSLFSGNVIERNLRDVLAAAQHNMVNEAVYELHGQVLLGFEDVAPIS